MRCRLIPFLLIVIIAEEVIPLVVIYAPFLLPSTCLLPSQKERIDAKKREKQKSFAESMQLVFQDVYKRSVEHPELTADMLLDRTAALSYNGFVVSFKLRSVYMASLNIAVSSPCRHSASLPCACVASRSTWPTSWRMMPYWSGRTLARGSL